MVSNVEGVLQVTGVLGRRDECSGLHIRNTIINKRRNEDLAIRQPIRPSLHFHVISDPPLISYFKAHTLLVYALARFKSISEKPRRQISLPRYHPPAFYTLAQASTNTDLKAAHRIAVSKSCLANMQKASETAG